MYPVKSLPSGSRGIAYRNPTPAWIYGHRSGVCRHRPGSTDISPESVDAGLDLQTLELEDISLDLQTSACVWRYLSGATDADLISGRTVPVLPAPSESAPP